MNPDAFAAPEIADIGPLAWIEPELRRQIDGALKALRRYQRGIPAEGDGDASAADAALLRSARQQLHQAGGALEMVGMRSLARLPGAMETVAQAFIDQPARCDSAAVATVERAAFALGEYLDALLAGKQYPVVGLFPQYRELLALAGPDRAHPAELWEPAASLQAPALVGRPAALAYGPAARGQFDQKVLSVVKTGDPVAARTLSELSLRLAAAQAEGGAREFWQVCAAFFEAQALDLLPQDLYAKRVASRVLMQYTGLVRGDAVQPQLLRDMLFFCAHARPASEADAPALAAVRRAWAMPQQPEPVDYERRRFGRFEPAQLEQARKRIASAADSWSALAGGDRGRLQTAVDQFGLVADSLRRLHAQDTTLSDALTRALDATLRRGQPPATALAMEVATSVLYLQAAYETLDTSDATMAERAAVLAGRLDRAGTQAVPEPLEAWMEALYHRVSERQTMGSVVEELRASSRETEHALDLYFRTPADTAPLLPVPGQLAQMRGVLSVLGLDQASLAVVRMRDLVERLLLGLPPDAQARQAVFESLGASLGALGFLIDMLAYQPMLARRLFVFDEAEGVLRAVMERAPQAAGVPTAELPAPALPVDRADADAAADPPAMAASDPSPIPSPAPTPAPQFPVLEEVDDDGALDLREIFLEEAREVVAAGLASLAVLDMQPDERSEQTAVRRAFHTLKGSARMVQLERFGEAAWAMEQLLNGWLAEQQELPENYRAVCRRSLEDLGRWAEDIGRGSDDAWDAAAFRAAADALRLGGESAVPDMSLPDMEEPPVVQPDAREPAPLEDPQEADAAGETAPADVSEMQVDELDFSAFTEALAEEKASAPEPEVPAAWLQPSQPPVSEEPSDPASGPEPEPESEAVGVAEPEPELEPEPEPEPEMEPESDADEMKVIDALRIPIPLYNVYLNEADEWSRRLLTELTEWSLELHQPLPESAAFLAHSLAGSSATVGFEALSDLARLLEQALEHLRHQQGGTPHQAGVFVDTGEDIRRLLHQFAAGFLKTPTPRLLRALQALIDTPAPQEDEPPSAAHFLRAAEADDFGPEDGTPAGPGTAEPVPDTLAPEIEDRVDADLFPVFEEEAAELLPQLVGALRRWAGPPADQQQRDELLRLLHTLKGSARLAGALRLGERAHRFEGDVEAMPSVPPADRLQALFAHADALQAGFESLREHDAHAQADIPPVQAPPSDAPGETAGSGSLESVGSAEPADSVEPDPEDAMVPEPPADTVPAASGSSRGVPVPARLPLVAPTRHSGASVRVRAGLLDRLVNEAGEVMISRSRLEARLSQMQQSLADLTGNLDRLRGQLRDVEVQSESQLQSRQAQARDSSSGFDPLEFDRFTRVQELTRMMAESVDDVATVQRALQRGLQGAEDDLVAQGRQARELQRDLLRTRMVEFDGVGERLHTLVRQAARETGKSAVLEIAGGSVEMDRGVLERLLPPLEHLLRNAVVHGIETPAMREAAGKPSAGAIRIAVRQDGNDVVIDLGDDGAGLDLRRIRDRALASGLLAADAKPSESALAELIFARGLSTASELTELAGRGIGMDVVRSEVQAVGGRVAVDSVPGRGLRFTMVLPLTTAVTQVVLLRAGGLTIGVPATIVEVVRRAPADEVDAAHAAGSLTHAGEQVPFFWCGVLLQSSLASQEPVGRTRPVVVLRSAGQRVALHVDEVLGQQEVVVKNLGPQLAQMPGLSAMTVLPSGAVVLVYNPVALVNVYGERIRAALASGRQGAADGATGLLPPVDTGADQALVLVVDDSITVRRVTQRLLRREGYRVALAADGLQALERLREERPALVLSDIEMPRMDGFDLLRELRANPDTADLPVVMITSRIAAKHRDFAASLGASHYLGKPYPEDELLALVRGYTRAVLTAE